MKRSFLFLTLGAMALASCTSEDVIDESIQSNAIGFENAVKKQSRAGEDAVVGDLTKDNLDKFIVYGYYTKANLSGNLIQVFGGDIVSKNKDTGKWEYKNTRYWVPEATYNFYAYSCADVVLDLSKGYPELNLNAVDQQDRELKISSFICDRNHQHDLIYSRVLGVTGKDRKDSSTAVNAPVSFSFNHVLSKVEVKFVSEFDPEYTVQISQVELVNFRNKGDYSPTRRWVNVSRQFENESTPIFVRLDFPDGNECRAGKAGQPELTAVTSSAYVIPYTYTTADVQLKFTIEITKDGKVVMSRNMTGSWRPNWDLGFDYTYTIRLTGSTTNLEPIVFETASDMNLDWKPGTGTATDLTFSAN